jgi:hypothetical protein
MEVFMECARCQGLMVVDYYIDMEDDQGTHWLRAWRCMACGEVIDPGIIQRRLVRELKLPGVIELATGRRKLRRTHHSVPT